MSCYLPINEELVKGNDNALILWNNALSKADVWKASHNEEKPICFSYDCTQLSENGPNSLWKMLKNRGWHVIHHPPLTVAVNCLFLRGIVVTPNKIAFRVNALWFNLPYVAASPDALKTEFEQFKATWVTPAANLHVITIEKSFAKIAFLQKDLTALELNLTAKEIIFRSPVLPPDLLSFQYTQEEEVLAAYTQWRAYLGYELKNDRGGA